MSHYCKIETQIVDQTALLAALKDFGYDKVEVHEEATHLYGYQGDVRPEKAHIVVRRHHISAVSNDIGFERNTDGRFEAIISEYDRTKLGETFVSDVCQAYAYHAVTRELIEKQGFVIERREVNKSTRAIHLVLRRSK